MRFSKVFRLKYDQPELDFVDVNTVRDLRLYVDPYSFTRRQDEWSLLCHNAIVSFFQAAIDLIRDGHESRAKSLLSNLHEPNETCLGLSKRQPQGRGVSGKQALDLYEALAHSEAVRSGMISEISECELLIPGIGPDKISDITTNVIRRYLIQYTQDQCRLHGIPLREQVPSGPIWRPESLSWEEEYTKLPIVNNSRILLIPKLSVRRGITFSHQKYYNHFVLNYLQAEHLSSLTSHLVQVLKTGERRVTKVSLKKEHPISKHFLYTFTKHHPEVLDEYKQSLSQTEPLSANLLDEDFDEAAFAETLVSRLRRIPAGHEKATTFHHLMIGTLEFIFYPSLMSPKKEAEINEGRKRIDITYTNSAASGLFFRIPTARRIVAVKIMVECKNYKNDPSNPELDQLSGRFSRDRGWVGILVARSFINRALFMARCRDTASAGRGFIIPLVDKDIERMLDLISEGRREQVDNYIDGIFDEIIS